MASKTLDNYSTIESDETEVVFQKYNSATATADPNIHETDDFKFFTTMPTQNSRGFKVYAKKS
jgi:hypothetical protein